MCIFKRKLTSNKPINLLAISVNIPLNSAFFLPTVESLIALYQNCKEGSYVSVPSFKQRINNKKEFRISGDLVIKLF